MKKHCVLCDVSASREHLLSDIHHRNMETNHARELRLKYEKLIQQGLLPMPTDGRYPRNKSGEIDFSNQGMPPAGPGIPRIHPPRSSNSCAGSVVTSANGLTNPNHGAHAHDGSAVSGRPPHSIVPTSLMSIPDPSVAPSGVSGMFTNPSGAHSVAGALSGVNSSAIHSSAIGPHDSVSVLNQRISGGVLPSSQQHLLPAAPAIFCPAAHPQTTAPGRAISVSGSRSSISGSAAGRGAGASTNFAFRTTGGTSTGSYGCNGGVGDDGEDADGINWNDENDIRKKVEPIDFRGRPIPTTELFWDAPMDEGQKAFTKEVGCGLGSLPASRGDGNVWLYLDEATLGRRMKRVL